MVHVGDMTALEEKMHLLNDALKNKQISQETYNRMVEGLKQKGYKMKSSQNGYKFRHSTIVKILLRVLLAIAVTQFFLLTTKFRLNDGSLTF